MLFARSFFVSSFVLVAACTNATTTSEPTPAESSEPSAPSESRHPSPSTANVEAPAAQHAKEIPCPYFDFDANKQVTSCDAATQYCVRSYLESDGPGSTNLCAPLPTGCTGCSCATKDADAAWRRAYHNTVNCSPGAPLNANLTVSCSAQDGAITVDCKTP